MNPLEVYTPKNRNESPHFFSDSQKEFLDGEVQEMQEDALLEDDFLGKNYNATKVYTQEFIDKWKQYVSEKEEKNDKNHEIGNKKFLLQPEKKTSAEHRVVREYFEALVYKRLGGPKGWLPDALVWKTSKTDDFRGIDFIVETKNREFSIAIDITSAERLGILSKLDQIKENILEGKLSSPIFYEPKEEGERPLFPKVIIATEFDKTVQLLKLWADNENVVSNHPMKIKILLELEAQLEAFATYAKALGKRYIASVYNDTLAQVQALIGDFSELIKRYGNHLDDDIAYKTIISFCENLKKESKIIGANSKRNES